MTFAECKMVRRLRPHCQSIGQAYRLAQTDQVAEYILHLVTVGYRLLADGPATWLVNPEGFGWPISASGGIEPLPLTRLDRTDRVVRWLWASFRRQLEARKGFFLAITRLTRVSKLRAHTTRPSHIQSGVFAIFGLRPPIFGRHGQCTTNACGWSSRTSFSVFGPSA